MLVAILATAFTFQAATGHGWVRSTWRAGRRRLRRHIQVFAFAAFALAFAIKVPMFPFHTWLPDAHVEARRPAR